MPRDPFSSLLAASMAGSAMSAIAAYVVPGLLRRRGPVYRSSTQPCIDVQTRSGGLTIVWVPSTESSCVVVGFAFRAPNDTGNVRGLDTAMNRCLAPLQGDTWARVVMPFDLNPADGSCYSIGDFTAKDALEAYRLMLRAARDADQERTSDRQVDPPLRRHVRWWNQRVQTLFFRELDQLRKNEDPEYAQACQDAAVATVEAKRDAKLAKLAARDAAKEAKQAERDATDAEWAAWRVANGHEQPVE